MGESQTTITSIAETAATLTARLNEQRARADTFLNAERERLENIELQLVEQLSQLSNEVASYAATIVFRRQQLTLNGRKFTDAWLAACAPKIANVTRVLLNDTSITDAGLAHLRSLEHLEIFETSSPGITGSGLKGFASPKLKTLYFHPHIWLPRKACWLLAAI